MVSSGVQRKYYAFSVASTEKPGNKQSQYFGPLVSSLQATAVSILIDFATLPPVFQITWCHRLTGVVQTDVSQIRFSGAATDKAGNKH